jgi:hypothetical protein
LCIGFRDALQANGLPSNMCILKGFPTTLAKSTTWFPFGLNGGLN